MHGAGVSWRDQAVALRICLDGHEGVIIVAGGVTFGEVQALEHMELIINLARLLHHKPHAVEDISNPLDLLHEGVD